MKGLLLFRLFLREIRKQRKRIFLTILAIVWGTLTIVLLLAFGEGLKRQLIKGTHGLGEGIVMVWGGQTSIPYQGLPQGRRILLREEDIKLIKEKIPQIGMISPELGHWKNSITYQKKTILRRVAGVHPCFKEMRNHHPKRGGRFINDLDLKFKRRVVFLGTNVKKDLFGKEKAVGKTITINDIPFTVIGVMVDKFQIGSYGDPDVDKATIPFSTCQTIFGGEYIELVPKNWTGGLGVFWPAISS